MKKRIVSLLLVLCMFVSMIPAQAVAAAFSDTGNSWALKSIERLSTLGVISGSNGSFRPDQPITRAEVATIYSNLMGYRAQAANTFSDLSSSSWYYEAMLKANAAMIFQGANGKINPDANITRQEFFVSFARVLGLADETQAAGFTDAADIASWALPQINALTKTKLLTGISNHDFTYRLEPLREITRAEVAALVDRAFPGIFKEAGTYSEAIKGNAVIAVPDITLSNLKIDGNLIIAEGVGEGEVTLDTLAVPARTVIRGGGANSVILKGTSTFGEILMDKNASEKPVSLKLDGTVHVNSIVVQEHSAQANVLVGGNASVDVMAIHNLGTILSGDGKVGLVTVSANNVQIKLPNTKIEVANGVTGTTVGGKPINGGTVTTTDKDGNIKTQETGGSSGGSGSVVQPPVTISFDTQGLGAIAPITVEWGSTVPALPILNKENATFLGWYLGDHLVDTLLSVRENITLTARFEETVAETLQEADTVFTLSEQETTLSFKLTAEGKDANAVKGAVTLENLNNTGDVTLAVTAISGGFTVTAEGGFTPNGAYRLSLAAGVNFAGKEDLIRTCEFTIKRTESAEITFSNSLQFLEADKIEAPTENGKSVSSLNIAPFTIDQASGQTTQNTTTGTLKLKEGAAPLVIGQVVCIYSGQSPENSRSEANIYDNNTAYVKITAYDDQTKVYTYTAAEAEEVLPTPDVLPVPTDADTDGDTTNNSITVAKEVFDYANPMYAPLDATTRADVGDFIGFYTGTFNDPSARTAQEPTFGQITAITEADTTYIVAYTPVTQEEMGEILNYYQKQDIDPEIMLENVNVPEVEAQIRQQAIDSGFAEKAANFLAGSIVAADDFDNALEGFDPDSVEVTTSDGAQMSLSQLRAAGGGRAVAIEDLIVIPRISTETKHFNQGTGLMCSVEVSFTVKLNDTFSIFVVAYFEEELRMSVSASGDIIWAWVWIIPYIDDYQFSASVDVFNYTNIKIKATLATVTDEVDISEVIEDILSLTDEKEQRGGISELYELYADMMDGPGDWVELFTKPLFQLNLNLAYGIIHVRIDVEFVVKVEVKVTIGMEFEYISGDQYNFWLRIFDRTSASNSVRLLDQKTNFNFFVMGTIGVRAGVKVGIRVGLFSVDLASIGFDLEAGVQARLSGFFFYEYRNVNDVTITNKCAGALYFELGVYMEIHFVAGAIGGKYQYQNMLFERSWPILTAGSRYNAYDFYELEDPLEVINLKKQNTTFYPPADLFSMQQLDLSTGENTKKQYPQSSFTIDFTNPAFTFDGNKIIVNPKPTDHTLDGNMVIRYKNASLSFTSLPITRTIRLHWDDLNDGGYSISFNSNGGSYVPFISALYNATITAPKAPTKVGYTFGGWFTDEALTTPYSFSKMGASNITLHAKWTANTDTPYTVEHWQESVTGGSYELFETETAAGTTNATIMPAVKSYKGFTAPGTQTLVVTGDGKATVRYEYRRNSYTLTFESGYGNASKDVVRSVRYGAEITPPKAAREGYTFTGWNSEVAEQMPAQDLTYTANWIINSYTVEFWLDGKRVDEQTLTRAFGAELTPYTPTLPSEFSTFSGWYTDSGFSTKFSGVTMPAKNLVLFGAVVDNAVTYTVKHYKQNLTGDGYLAPESELHTAGKGASITPGVKSYDGFTAPATQTVTLADDGTTVVEYHYDRNKYDLVFEKDDGGILASAPEKLILPYEMEITLPTPTAQGYDFVHWYLEGDTEQAAYTAATMPGKNITLKPKFAPSTNTAYTVEHWFENVDDEEYTRDDTKTQSATGATGAQTAAVALTGIAGFTAKPVTQKTIAADGSTVVKCEYSRNSYTITFLSDAGNLMDSALPQPISGKYGAAVTLPSGVTAQGYTFAHWHKSGQSDTAYAPATMPAESLTLYPKFTPNTDTAYTVEHYTYPDGVVATLYKSEPGYGTTGEQTAEVTPLGELLSDGYTMRAVSAKTISADGSTVLQCVYDKPIEFKGNGLDLINLVPTLYDGATLKLTDDVVLPGIVTITKRLTIDGGGHTVTAAQMTKLGHLFEVSGYCDSTVQNITLDGSNVSTTGLIASPGTYLTLGPRVTIQNFEVGVSCEGASLLTIDGADITLNQTGLVGSYSTIVMNSGSIHHNTAKKDDAVGGVALEGTSFTMNGGSITDNVSTGIGGGVYLGTGIFTMTGGEILNNKAPSGGGIGADGGSQTIYLFGGTIKNNTATTSGGGIFAWGTVINWGNNEFTGTVITNNSAPTNPGIHNEGGTLNNPNGNVAS